MNSEMNCVAMVFARCFIAPPVNKHNITKKYRAMQV